MDFDIGDINDIITKMDCEVESEVEEKTSARFGSVVSDEDLRSFIEGQENRNTKYNTKWAFNVFEKMARAERWRNRDHSCHYSLDGTTVLSVVSRALKFKRLYVIIVSSWHV
jgi:hypothetical protein